MCSRKAAGAGCLAPFRIKVIEAFKGADYDSKGAIERIADDLGAGIYQNNTKTITHFVVAQQSPDGDGDVATLARKIAQAARASPNAYIVSQLWVHECARRSERVPEEHYRIEAENLQVVPKGHRRCKSTVPAKVDEVNLDLTAPFFSSTQVLQQAEAVPMARKQGYRTRRQESALENMPRFPEQRAVSPATSASKDDQLAPEHARILYKDRQPAPQHISKKNVTFSVGRLPSRRRNTVHGHVPHAQTCLPPSMGRPGGLHVDFQLPHNLSPGSAVKARTRNRAPSLDFMVARIGMPLPIIRDEGRALKRNDALFLAAANASRANTPRSEIPIPVVRSVSEQEIAQQSNPSNRPRRRRQIFDPTPVDRSARDGPSARNPREALAMGVWTDHRPWDHLPHYRPPASPATTACLERRALSERIESPRVEATPAGEVSSGLVVPDSTYPTGARAQASLQPPADVASPSCVAAQQYSDGSAQENMASPSDGIEPYEKGTDAPRAGLFSCLAAMGHHTRTRLSALAAVVPTSPDGPGQPVEAAPDPMPSAAAGERRESSAQAAEVPAPPRKGNVAARELGIVDFVAQMGRSRHSDAATHSAAVRRTRAGSSVPPPEADRAAQTPIATAATPSEPQSQRPRDTQLSIEPVLDVHVPRAKRSVRVGSARGGIARALKRLLPDVGDEPAPMVKRFKPSASARTAAREPVARVVQDSADEMESDEDFDMKSTLAVQRRAQNRQWPTNGKAPKTPIRKTRGLVCELNVQTDELPLALRDAGLDTSAVDKQRKRPAKGAGSKVKNLRASAAAEEAQETLCVTCSGVSGDVEDRCRRAVKRLGNATMVETEEEVMKTKLTHLVMGSNKKTGKLLLARASGAVVVRPDWLVQCIRWRRWLPTEEFLFECGNPQDGVCQIEQQVARSKMGQLLAPLKVHVTSAAAAAKMDCVRVQLFRKLVTLMGGEHVRASSCEVCILVSPEAPRNEQNSAQLSKKNGTGRRQRHTGACKNQVDVQKLGLPSDAIVVGDSWLKDTIELRQRQPYMEHSL